VAVDLPHYQHHPHLQSCWQKNLGVEDLIFKTVAKVGMACQPPFPQKRNISPHCCLNPLRFLVFDSKTADEPVSHEISLSITETVQPLLGATEKSQLTQVATSAREFGKMLFLPT